MNGRDLLNEANIKREQGSFLESLVASDKALVKFAGESDLEGMAETLASRSLCFKLMFTGMRLRQWAELSLSEARASVTIAEQSRSKEAMALPVYNLAKAYELVGRTEEAAANYQKAIELQESAPAKIHDRVGVLLDMKIHLTTLELKLGNEDKMAEALKLLDELASSNEDLYNRGVWMSGGYMRLAEAVAAKNPTKAAEMLEKAREVIDTDDRLEIRKKQLEKIEQEIVGVSR